MREYGFTAFSGLPAIAYRGFKAGKPILDFRAADAAMKLAKELGFLAVVSYGAGVSGIDAYFQDTGQMGAAGFKDYAAFLKAIYSQIEEARRRRTAGFPFTTTSPTSRSATTCFARRRMPRPIGALSPGSALLHGGQQLHRQRPARIPTSGSRRLSTWSRGTTTTRRPSSCSTGGRGLGVLQRRQPLDLTAPTCTRPRSIRHEVPARVALGMVPAGDPYYWSRLRREDDYAWCNAPPDGRPHPVGRVRAASRGAGRLSAIDHPGQAGPARAGTQGGSGRPRVDRGPRTAAFRLDQTAHHDALFPPEDWIGFRRQVDDLIEALDLRARSASRLLAR